MWFGAFSYLRSLNQQANKGDAVLISVSDPGYKMETGCYYTIMVSKSGAHETLRSFGYLLVLSITSGKKLMNGWL